ncbi:hypothetical protein UFOVP6_8 [uncultured Caudovirales phage]|uniref:Uncharacterized protein n=1 Tax=uncultured Caudovirales phage TaxID=2100421 RepID=A0A6J5KIS3_9CAUD|nr:hypothetical protein UFOVP6_8 [uncultured Caudovirales phage]
MFYVWHYRERDLTKFYWNRKAREWETTLSPACAYPTARGADRQHKVAFDTLVRFPHKDGRFTVGFDHFPRA